MDDHRPAHPGETGAWPRIIGDELIGALFMAQRRRIIRARKNAGWI
jgi:hypothetical protein